MPAILRLDPVGSGKDALASNLLRAGLRQAKAFPRLWVLTATRRQAFALREGLAAQSRDAACFNIETFTFYQLNQRLLSLARQPARGISPDAQIALLRQLVARMQSRGELRHFAGIASARGFIEVVAAFITELKRNGIADADFMRAAQDAKERDIAHIYQRYQRELIARDLVDVEGEGWLALARLRRDPIMVADVDLLLVHGFDQFTPVQARTLAQLASVIPQTHITLTLLPGKAGEISRRGALARDQLSKAFEEAGVALQTQSVPGDDSQRHPGLLALGRVLFQNRAAADSSDAIRMLAMPSEVDEVKAVLRRVKRQLRDGVRPDDILIALRDWGRYEAHFRTVGAEYGLPLRLVRPSALASHPLVARLIDLLQLGQHCRRRDLLDILRSPYLISGLDEPDIDLLDRVSRQQLFVRGSSDDWIAMINRAGSASHDSEDAEANDAFATLAERLQRFFTCVTPPTAASFHESMMWLENLLPESAADAGDIGLHAPTPESDSDNLAAGDSAALDRVRQTLRQASRTQALLRSSDDAAPEIAWDDFWSDICYALERAAAPEEVWVDSGKTLVATATDARGLPHDHVYIVGLAEGVFPLSPAEDPLFLDSERLDLSDRGIPLAPAAERVDDSGLFAELTSLARVSLTVSRAQYQDGKPRLESVLWRSLRSAFPRQPVIAAPAGHVASTRDAASPGELLLALADDSNAEDALRHWLPGRPALSEAWRRVARGVAIESSRLSRQPPNNFSGQLQADDSLGRIEAQLGGERIWSASQLKDYGLCGFRFFAKRLLKLEADDEPSAGYDVLQLGALNHSILEETYARFRDLRLAIKRDNLGSALQIFDEVAAHALARAPATHGFHAPAAWQAERDMLQRRLRAAIIADFADDSPLNQLDGTRTVRSVESYFGDIAVELPSGEKLRLRGLIDRVDQAGSKLLVVDYKTGTTAINRVEMENGRDFQMMTYVLALRQMLARSGSPATVKGGLFWHLRSLKTSGRLDVAAEADQAAMDKALSHIERYLSAARRGSFPAQPTGDAAACASYCEFTRLCRVSIVNRSKASLDG